MSIIQLFTQHPHDTGETYGEHLFFTWKMTGRLLYAAGALLLHGFFPFVCVYTASNGIKSMYRTVMQRAAAAQPLSQKRAAQAPALDWSI